MTSSRRDFFMGLGRGAFRLSVLGALVYGVGTWFRGPAQHRALEKRLTGILRPPGALENEDAFLAACIRCDLCSQVCDTQCIRIFGLWEGKLAGTPHIVADVKACNLCLKCTEVCPSAALLPLKDKKDVRMGLALVDERLCVSHNGTGACGACHTICPLHNKAITQGLRNAPTVHEDHCVGCGRCEEVCIVDDRKAIRVKTERSWS
jgi:ferredoxin-type protein NapG